MALARLGPGGRRALIIGGAVLLIVGAVLIGLFVVQFGNAVASGVLGALPNFYLMFLGMPLVVVGLFIVMLGSRKALVELAATDSAPAVQHLAHAAGTGLASTGFGSSQVKVRCLHCGSLDSEDAAYCSKCGKSMRAAPAPRA
jgi:hypothetical protein